MHAANLRESVHALAGNGAGENVVPAERKCGASGGGAGVLSTIFEQVGNNTSKMEPFETNRSL